MIFFILVPSLIILIEIIGVQRVRYEDEFLINFSPQEY